MCEELFHKTDGSGDASLVIAFGILEDLVVTMDTSYVVSCDKKISDQCSVSLQTLGSNPAAFQNVGHIARSVNKAKDALKKRLRE